MQSPVHPPRKRRTRQHIIADLSVHHVEGFILEEGHTVQRLSSDYGYDLMMHTFDENGYFEAGSVYFQLKASDALQTLGSNVVFDIDIRDYNLWMDEEKPVILILYDASRKRAYWIGIQRYFRGRSHHPKRGARTVRIRVPKQQILDRKAIAEIRELKPETRRARLGILT